jgi:hypothetical protein
MSQADILSSIAQVTGVGPKHWQLFDEKSPRGVPMTGYICLQESDYLGALALTSIDGKEHFEIIPSIPKIHYPYVEDAREGTVRVSVPLPINVVDVRFTTKLDGTCIIFYALPDEDGHPIEIVPRTRLNPVLTASRWGDWPAMLAKVLPDHSGVERAVRDQKMVLCFELWGYRNPHRVRYDTPLALSFHTAIRRSPGHLASHRTLQDLAGRYGFDLVKSIRVEQPDAVALEAAYRALQAQMEARNQAAPLTRRLAKTSSSRRSSSWSSVTMILPTATSPNCTRNWKRISSSQHYPKSQMKWVYSSVKVIYG